MVRPLRRSRLGEGELRTPLRSRNHGRRPGGDLLLASADPALRKRLIARLRREPGIGRVRLATDRAALERALVTLSPTVLVLDSSIGGADRPGRLRTIRALSPVTRTLLLARAPDDAAALRALKEGARGYCPRTTEPELMARAVQLVRQGEIWIGRKVMRRLIDELAALHARRTAQAEDQLRGLTAREREICDLVAGGASNKEIADRLSIREGTVKAHLTHVFGKLGFSSRLQLAIFALQAGAPPMTKVQ